jgi:hypothetical protein
MPTGSPIHDNRRYVKLRSIRLPWRSGTRQLLDRRAQVVHPGMEIGLGCGDRLVAEERLRRCSEVFPAPHSALIAIVSGVSVCGLSISSASASAQAVKPR